MIFVKVEGGGCKVDWVLLVVIVFLKFFELVFELLMLDNLVFGVVVLNDLEFKMVDLEGRLFLYFGLLFIVLFMFW